MEMQRNPNSYPNSNSGVPLLHTTNYSAVNSHNLNSEPYEPPGIDNALFLPQPQPQPQPWPPGVDPPYVPPHVAVNYSQPPPTSFEPQQVAAAAYYYPDPNVSWAAAITQIGATHYAADVTTPNTASRSQIRNIFKQGLKKTKVVQSARCDVCKIDCNSRGVLEQHELGKKHQKNLQKLKVTTASIPGPAVVATSTAIVAPPPPAVLAPSSAAIDASTPLPASTLAPIDKPIIGPEEYPEKSKNFKKARKKAAARTENLETKRRKVLEGGATAQAVRACSVCNVVCNSDTVFNYHLAGQRHAKSMVKKYTSNAAGVDSAL